MTNSKRAAEIIQSCYDTAKAQGRETRDVANEIIPTLSPDLIRFMAAEFVVAAVARAQRAAALDVERSAERHERQLAAEGSSRIPRKGTAARRDWEMNTPEGQMWAGAAAADEMRSLQMFYGVIGSALDRYAEDLRIKWTSELLDSTFALSDGAVVTWGEATIEQHAERRQMFLNNAHGNMEGAARHEIAMRELKETGADCLRAMVSVDA